MKTDNELIAAFMGGIKDNRGNPIYLMPNGVGKHPAHVYKIREMEFDTSWDWLMPVVEKISKIVTPECEVINNGDESRFDSFYLRTFGMLNAETKQFMVRINRFPLYQSDTLIDATYQAVLEFIEWYNETKK